MTKFNFGDVVLIIFTQPDGKRKQRPALIILDIGNEDIVLAPITSKERSGIGDCKIKDWQGAGLLVSSWTRLAKVTCLSKKDISRSLGSLSSDDRKTLASAWQALYRVVK